jgi:hypothetical protein
MTGAGELEGGSVRWPHNFISLGDPKDHIIQPWTYPIQDLD